MKEAYRLRTSPSILALVMENDCQRALYFHSISKRDAKTNRFNNKSFLKNKYGIDVDAIEGRQVVKNSFRQDAGEQLEKDILEDKNIPDKLKKGSPDFSYGVKNRYYDLKGAALKELGYSDDASQNDTDIDHEDAARLIYEKTEEILKDIDSFYDSPKFEKKYKIKAPEYLYQAAINATEDFKKDYSFDDSFTFRVSFPDLIMITADTARSSGLKLSIIDIKMAEHVRLKQKIQVSLYAILLDYLVKELKLKNIRVNMEEGYIWHKGNPRPSVFNMSEVLPHVNDYLTEALPALTKTMQEGFSSSDDEEEMLSSLPKQLSHRLCSHCEYCAYMDYCLKESRDTKDYQLLPYISAYGQRCLEELYASDNNDSVPSSISYKEISDLFKNNIKNDEIKDIIDHNPSLRQYIKTDDNGVLFIDKYSELLSIATEFNYRELRAFPEKSAKIDLSVILSWLNALRKQKEADKKFISGRKEALEKYALAQDSENADDNSYGYLKNYISFQQNKLDTINDIEGLAGSIYEKLEKGTPLEELSDDFKSLYDTQLAPKQFFIKKISVLDFPLNTSDTIRVFITAQKDEITDRMYALAYYARVNIENITDKTVTDKLLKLTEQDVDKTDGNPRYISIKQIFLAEAEDCFDIVEERFIDSFHSFLCIINDFNTPYNNASRDGYPTADIPKFRLQCFVMDTYEADNIMEMFYDVISRTASMETASKIIDILSWFQDERMANSDITSSAIGCDHPFVIITQTVKRLFILPTEIAYSFDDISNMFAAGKAYHNDPRYYSNYFSNAISSGYIRECWKNAQSGKSNKNKCKLEYLKYEISSRLTQASRIHRGILNELATEEIITGYKYLVSYPAVFMMPMRNKYKAPLLSKLSFQCLYEQLLDRLDYRYKRMGDIDDLIADNVITKLNYRGMTRLSNSVQRHDFEILNYNDGTVIPDMGLTFAPADEDLLKGFTEHGNIISTSDGIWGKFAIQTYNDKNILHVELLDRNAFSYIVANDYFMFERYTDWTSPSIIGGRPNRNGVPYDGILKRIDDNAKSGKYFEEDILKLLCDPCAFVSDYLDRHTSPEDNNSIDADECLKYENKYFEYPFAESQKEAFLSFYNKNLSLIQGPPGTGKTNFIAMSVLIYLIRSHQNNEAPKRIFVTSNSHVAIENVLRKIGELLDYIYKNVKDFNLPLDIFKAVGSSNDSNTDTGRIEIINKEAIGNSGDANRIFRNPKNVILGATVWALEKPYQQNYLNKNSAFDVVIIDEASQVKLVDSTIALAHIKKDGKILLVGDHEQLPPIIKGNYKANDEEKAFSAGSVFKYFIDHDRLYEEKHGKPLYSVQLREQFRMNEILSLYPCTEIYNGDYKPFEDGSGRIARQKLKLKNDETNTGEICNWIMDPEYPFVLINIKSADGGGFLTADAKKHFEVQLVKELTEYCMNNLCNNDGILYDDAEKFWHNGLFIISPHHEHINRLRAAIRDLKRNDLPEDAGNFGEHAFIDTVDKMQGQESDVALVSYGISDENQAVREKEFVYNRNRLNVSITRGKKKMILILTDVLTEKQLELLAEEDQKLIDSIGFMNSIKDFAAANEITVISKVSKSAETLSVPYELKDDWVTDGKIIVETYRKKCSEL